MATGVLVCAVGEGTKLVPYLVAAEKVYEATIMLGAETDSLDADGAVTRNEPVPALDRSQIDAAARSFVGTYLQRAPRLSALKHKGRALHERVRRGEDVEAPEREVTVSELSITAVGSDRIECRVRCGKGFYVRSLARDLARACGTVGHLCALRRTGNGPFAVSDATSFDRILAAVRGTEADREELRGRVLSLRAACAHLPQVQLDTAGADDAHHGRRIPPGRYAPAPSEEGVGPLALIDPAGQLVAIGTTDGTGLRVLRGFRVPEAGVHPGSSAR
jgi:tRNA pseudouridine55 synthase